MTTQINDKSEKLPCNMSCLASYMYWKKKEEMMEDIRAALNNDCWGLWLTGIETDTPSKIYFDFRNKQKDEKTIMDELSKYMKVNNDIIDVKYEVKGDKLKYYISIKENLISMYINNHQTLVLVNGNIETADLYYSKADEIYMKVKVEYIKKK
jgi:hypothetical protein